MNETKAVETLSSRDKLLTRPAGALPTCEDPAGPHARGYPADPKPSPPISQGNPGKNDPEAGGLGRPA